LKKQINHEELVPKQEKFIKDIQINQKKRTKTLLLFLIVFNVILLLSMIYCCLAFNRTVLTVVLSVVYILVVWRSLVTIKKAKINTQVELYEDLIIISSYRGRAVIDLKYVFLAKPKRNLIQLVFKKPAKIIMLVVRNEKLKRVFIPFVDEDTQKICDTITILSIKERSKKSPK